MESQPAKRLCPNRKESRTRKQGVVVWHDPVFGEDWALWKHQRVRVVPITYLG